MLMAHWFNLFFHVLILGSTHSILNKISSTCALKKKDVNRYGKNGDRRMGLLSYT